MGSLVAAVLIVVGCGLGASPEKVHKCKSWRLRKQKIGGLIGALIVLCPLNLQVLVAQEKKVTAGQFSGWSIYEKNDPLDGRKTFLMAYGRQAGTNLFVSYKHTPPSNPWMNRMHQFFISFNLGKELRCPHVEQNVPRGVDPGRYVLVRWKLDEGPVHNQRYSLGCQGNGCDIASYMWQVLSVEQAGYIDRYRKLPKHKHFDEDFYTLPHDRMVHLLRKASSFYLRVSDRCESVDIQVDLRGLDEALTASGIQTQAP